MDLTPVEVLLVDADLQRRIELSKHLVVEGFTAVSFSTLVALGDRALLTNVKLVIIAADQDPVPGLALCCRLRSDWPALPIIFLESGDSYHVRIAALNAGADDALSYPFELQEFTARIRALIRRASSSIQSYSISNALIHRDLVIDLPSRSVKRCGETVRLTVKEYDLLLYLLKHKERVCARKEILHAVWGDTWVGDDNLLDVYIRYLRKKIERPDLEPLIHTIRGVGFMLK